MPAKITQVSFWPVQPPRFRTAKGGSIMEHTSTEMSRRRVLAVGGVLRRSYKAAQQRSTF